MANMDEFTDVVVKCTDGELKTHKLALLYISPMFRDFYKTHLTEHSDPEVPFTCSVLKIILNKLFYHKLLHVVNNEVTYADLLPLYKCCEFLLIPEKDARTLMISCTYIMKGKYHESASEVFIKYPDLISDKIFRALPAEHLVTILPLLDNSPKSQLMVTTLDADMCYKMYKHDPTIIEQHFTCYGYVSDKIAERINFSEFYDIYMKLCSALLGSYEELYGKLLGFTLHALKHVTKKGHDPTFDPVLYETVAFVLGKLKL